jgi:hypothetical protein
MKKLLILLGAIILGATSASAQLDWGSALGKLKDAASDMVNSVTDSSSESNGESGSSITEGLSKLFDSILPKVEIPGTWSYLGVAVEFDGEGVLAAAGGAVAAATVEEKLAPLLAKVGIKPGAFSFTFNEDGTLTTQIGKKPLNGKWVYDEKAEVVTITILNKEYAIRMVVSGDNINILFEADKLLELLKSISSKSSNTTLATIGTIVQSYDGMNLGFECKRVK